MPTDSHISRPLRLCPQCGYNLTKLSDDKSCPGCAEKGGAGRKANNGKSDAIISVTLAFASIPAIFFWGVFTVVLSSFAIFFGIRARKIAARGFNDTTTPLIAATGIVIGVIMLGIGTLVTGALLIGLTYIFTAS